MVSVKAAKSFMSFVFDQTLEEKCSGISVYTIEGP